MDTSAKIACCLICTLAQAMKDCKHCPFAIGLKARQEQAQAKENTEFIKQEVNLCSS